jgi:hypothetical protein
VADYAPVYRNGSNPFTMTASATITGGQLLDASGSGTVAPAGAASTIFVGVAAHDCASGSRITVWPIPGVVHETTTPAGVTAGASLATAAAGTVNSGTVGTLAAAGSLLGTALTTAGAAAKARWLGR